MQIIYIDESCLLWSSVPGISIATDIICGFPTETEEDFEETMKLCAKFKFPSLFINQYFPRPGTPAARLERLPAQTVPIRISSPLSSFCCCCKSGFSCRWKTEPKGYRNYSNPISLTTTMSDWLKMFWLPTFLTTRITTWRIIKTMCK